MDLAAAADYLKLTDFRCHAGPKAKNLGSELTIRKPDSSPSTSSGLSACFTAFCSE
jgi:hypothetical protein